MFAFTVTRICLTSCRIFVSMIVVTTVGYCHVSDNYEGCDYVAHYAHSIWFKLLLPQDSI